MRELAFIAPPKSRYWYYRHITIRGFDLYGQPVNEDMDIPWHVPSSPQIRRYLAVKHKQHKRPFTPHLRCQRSSRRLAVLAKRKRLGLPPDGKIHGYSRTLSYLAAETFLGPALTKELTGYQW